MKTWASVADAARSVLLRKGKCAWPPSVADLELVGRGGATTAPSTQYFTTSLPRKQVVEQRGSIFIAMIHK